MLHIQELQECKLEIVSKAVENNDFESLTKCGFFEKISQIERSKRIHVSDRIWIGRMLKMVFGKSAPNPGKIAIFQEPKQYKRIRQWESQQKDQS